MGEADKKASPLKDLIGDKLYVNKGGDKDLVGFYFSAHWCPPCRNFTPVLKEAFNKMDGDKITIIFVSSDQDEAGMKDYFKSHGDYLALPFAARDKKKALSEKFGVQGIPMLVIVSKDGKTVDAGGRGTVQKNGEKALEEWSK